MPEPLRTRNLDRAERKFDLMAELGTKFLGMCSSVSEDTADDKERAAADLAELADRAAQRGFRIGYEALAWGRYVRDWMQAYELVCMADRPNLGIVLDTSTSASTRIRSRRSPTFRRRASGWCSSRMRPASSSRIRCRCRVITAAFRGRAIIRSRRSSTR